MAGCPEVTPGFDRNISVNIPKYALLQKVKVCIGPTSRKALFLDFLPIFGLSQKHQ